MIEETNNCAVLQQKIHDAKEELREELKRLFGLGEIIYFKLMLNQRTLSRGEVIDYYPPHVRVRMLDTPHKSVKDVHFINIFE